MDTRIQPHFSQSQGRQNVIYQEFNYLFPDQCYAHPHYFFWTQFSQWNWQQ